MWPTGPTTLHLRAVMTAKIITDLFNALVHIWTPSSVFSVNDNVVTLETEEGRHVITITITTTGAR